jgi:hypothetical protein
MSALEAWQFGLGPLAHSYFRVLYLSRLTEPGSALPRRCVLFAVVWIHGAIGIHTLRFRP